MDRGRAQGLDGQQAWRELARIDVPENVVR
jgi:hypothetical protein